MSSTPVTLWRRVAAEFLGSGFLAAVVTGSGIAAQRLSPGETGLAALARRRGLPPGASDRVMRATDRATGRLLGLQLFGHRYAEIAKRIDIAATAIFNNMTVDAVSDLGLVPHPAAGQPQGSSPDGRPAWLRAIQGH